MTLRLVVAVKLSQSQVAQRNGTFWVAKPVLTHKPNISIGCEVEDKNKNHKPNGQMLQSMDLWLLLEQTISMTS
jgi:hypothetical protein